MPRRSTLSLASEPHLQSTTSLQSSPSALENLAVLRTQWKWAAFCQFFFTFAPLFAMNDVSVADIELDLVEGASHVIPRIMTRLLYTLSYDRKVSTDNWQSMLQKQYAKRAPNLNALGVEPRLIFPIEDKILTEENVPHTRLITPSVDRDHAARPESVSSENKGDDWYKLPMLQKLDSMHLLTEWHFQHPMRLRTLMKSDDENASWRIEPIGYDKQRNAYWLIGPDRLWIQRALPQPQRWTNHSDNNRSLSWKRRRLDKSSKSGNSNSIQSIVKHRAAKTEGTVKLDVYTKSPLKIGHIYDPQDARYPTNKTASHPNIGTRVSARLRGVQQDEWQLIPREWVNSLDEGGLENGPGPIQRSSGLKTGLESDLDDMSELTELSDDSNNSHDSSKRSISSISTKTQDMTNSGDSPQKELREGIVEWETICSTLHDWEHISDHFASGTHYSEKALYKYLINDLVPIVTENLKVAERQKRLEDAIIYRKRSSRIALKESEKEQALAAARKRTEEEEKLSRAKRLEMRQRRGEERRMRLENAREQRREERKLKELLQQERDFRAEQGTKRVIPHGSSCSSRISFPEPQPNLTWNSSNSPRVGSWVLDCEICHKWGISPADDTPMMSCGSCLRWQHIACHDNAYQRAGLPKCDWDSVDFICQSCRTKSDGYRPTEPDAPLGSDNTELPRKQILPGRSSSTADGQPIFVKDNIPGHKHPTALCDPVWHPLLTSPLAQVSDAGMSLQGQTAKNLTYNQARWDISLPPHLQPLSESRLSLQRGEYRDLTFYERSSIFNQSNRGIPHLSDAS